MRHWRFSGSRPGAWALGRLLRCAVFLGRWTRAVPCPPGAGLSDHVKPEAPSAGPWVTASGCPGLPRAPVGSRAFSGGRGVQAVSPSSQEIPWGHRALHSSGHAGPGPLPAPRWWTCSPRAPCRPGAGPGQAPRGALPSQMPATQTLLPSSQACVEHLLPRSRTSAPVSHTPSCHLAGPAAPREARLGATGGLTQPHAPGRCGPGPPPPGRGSRLQRLRD